MKTSNTVFDGSTQPTSQLCASEQCHCPICLRERATMPEYDVQTTNWEGYYEQEEFNAE